MLLGKATRALGDVRLVDLRSEEICAWQRTLPDGHRFEATQALRQVLNRAVAWELIEINPAKRGVDNPLRLSSAGSCARGARAPRAIGSPVALSGAPRRGRRRSQPAFRRSTAHIPAPYVCDLCAPRRRLDLRPLTVHGRKPDDDRPPLRTPCSRRPPARGSPFSTPSPPTAARGRSVDVATGIGNPLSYSIEFVTLDGV